MPLAKNEPVITTAAITALAAAALALLVAFWPGALSDAQQDALMGLVAVSAPLAVAAIARGRVTPNSRVLEVLIGDTVVAGEANDQVLSGTDIRQVEPKRAA